MVIDQITPSYVVLLLTVLGTASGCQSGFFPLAVVSNHHLEGRFIGRFFGWHRIHSEMQLCVGTVTNSYVPEGRSRREMK